MPSILTENATWDFKEAADKNNEFIEMLKKQPMNTTLGYMREATRASKLVRAGGMFEREDGKNVSNQAFKGSKTGKWISCAYFTSKSAYEADLVTKGYAWPRLRPVSWHAISDELRLSIEEKFPTQGGFKPEKVIFMFFSGDKFVVPKAGVLGTYENPKTGFEPKNMTGEVILVVLMGAITIDREVYLRQVLKMTPLAEVTKVVAEVRAAVKETPALVIVDDWV